jgi:hypothetical protein
MMYLRSSYFKVIIICGFVFPELEYVGVLFWTKPVPTKKPSIVAELNVHVSVICAYVHLLSESGWAKRYRAYCFAQPDAQQMDVGAHY